VNILVSYIARILRGAPFFVVFLLLFPLNPVITAEELGAKPGQTFKDEQEQIPILLKLDDYVINWDPSIGPIGDDAELIRPPGEEFFPIVVLPAPEKPERPKEEPPELMFYWLGSLNAFITNSELVGSSRIIGGNVTAVLAPVLQIDKEVFLIGMYNGSYRKSKQIFADDEGPKLSSETMQHTLSPTFRYAISRTKSISFSIFRTISLTKQTENEKWYKGLYDYWETGGTIQYSYLFGMTSQSQSSINVGGQYYFREYPNFRSLFSIAGLGQLEEKEKDFVGAMIFLVYSKNQSLGLSYSANLSYAYKDYVDKEVENEVGGRTGEKQHDDLYNLALTFTYKPSDRVDYKLSTSVSRAKSNQNLAQGSFPFVIFHNDYYSSVTTRLSPSISYKARFSEKNMLIMSASYSFSRLKQDSRKARKKDGGLKDETEENWIHTVGLSLLYTLNKRWSIGSMLDYTTQSSNNADESVYRSSYGIFNFSLGFSFKY